MNNLISPRYIKQITKAAENQNYLRIVVKNEAQAKALLQLLHYYEYEWSGDSLLNKTYFPVVNKAIRYTMSKNSKRLSKGTNSSFPIIKDQIHI